jgi:carbonic anhydrase
MVQVKVTHEERRPGEPSILFKRTTLKLVPLALVSMILLLAGAAVASSEEGDIELEPPEPGPHFGYAGAERPARWAELSPDWVLCGEGLQQSPIDLDAKRVVASELSDIEFDYHPTVAEWLNNGHTVELVYEHESSITVDGVEYDLLQFHFHTPSEHTVQGGARFPLEAHLVHRSAAGELAVIGVWIREGAHLNGFYFPRRLKQVIPLGEGVTTLFPDQLLSAAALLPANRRTFRYMGSLTTPPCSEGVHWFVMADPIEMSAGQIRALTDIMSQLAGGAFNGFKGTNNRPTQPLNGREVTLDVP